MCKLLQKLKKNFFTDFNTLKDKISPLILFSLCTKIIIAAVNVANLNEKYVERLCMEYT